MKDYELDAFCSLVMCSDPSPISEKEMNYIQNYLDEQCKSFGYENWVSFLHRNSPKIIKQSGVIETK